PVGFWRQLPLLCSRTHPALVFAGPEVVKEAGSIVNLPCDLTGPSVSWRWVPRYPVCAGVSGGIQMIYIVTAAGERYAPEGRFKERLRLQMSQETRPSVLQLRPLHMNDSGAFSCASPSQSLPLISVTVTPGNSPDGGWEPGLLGSHPGSGEGPGLLGSLPGSVRRGGVRDFDGSL
uniref:Ig-like domain-containing protein n=1 Tax=Chelydra serpentina TaxID=8475 RepID=A0A8C3XP36_CHESE